MDARGIPSRSQRLLSLHNFHTGLGSLSSGVNLLGREADLSRPTPRKENQCSYIFNLHSSTCYAQKKGLSISFSQGNGLQLSGWFSYRKSTEYRPGSTGRPQH